MTYDITVSKRTSSAGLFTSNSATTYGIWVSGFGRTMNQTTGSTRYSTVRFTNTLPVFDPPPFYYTEPYLGAPLDRCQQVQVAVQYQGQGLYVTDYDDTYYPANGQPGRDDFVFLATFPDWNIDTDPTGIKLEYRWPGNAGWSPAFFNIFDTIVVNGGADSAVTFRIGTSVGRYLSQVQWRCSDEGPGGQYFLPWWDPGPSITEPAWQEFAAYANPCSSLVITLPSGSIAPGEVARVPYSLPTSDGLDLEVFAYGVPNFSPSTTPRIPVYSYSALGGQTGGDVPFLNYVAPGSGRLTFTLPATVDEPLDFADLVFSCGDQTVTGVIVPGSADLGLTGSINNGGNDDDGESSSVAACFSFPKMSLTSPASWVRGLGGMFVCLVRVVVVPDGDTVAIYFTELKDVLADRPPFSLITMTVSFASDLSNSFSNAAGSGCFDALGFVDEWVNDGGVCFGDAVNTTSAQRQTLFVFMAAPLAFALLGSALSLVRDK